MGILWADDLVVKPPNNHVTRSLWRSINWAAPVEWIRTAIKNAKRAWVISRPEGNNGLDFVVTVTWYGLFVYIMLALAGVVHVARWAWGLF